MRKSLFQDTNMTEGNLFKKILLFSLPVIATAMLQLLYVSIDLMTVHFGDSAESMGAIASNNALIKLIIVVFINVSLGVNVVLSEARGANNKEKAEKVVHTSLLFSLFSGLAVGLVGFFISDNLLEWMGTEAHYFDKAALYLKIYFCGLPFLMIYNYASAILRAEGDSKSPFLALLVSGIINVGFDCLFVFGFDMDVDGVGYATIIAEAISAIFLLIVLFKKKSLYVSLEWKKFKIDGKSLLDVMKIGLPAGLQGFFFSLPNVFIQSSLYTIDPNNVNLENGAIASGNIEGYYLVLVDSIASSTMTFIAANVGAKNKENIKKCVIYGAIWGFIASALIALITGTLYWPLLRLFVEHEEAIEAGRQRLFIFGFFYTFNFLQQFTAAVLRGLKKSTIPMLSTMIFCTVLRIVLIWTVFPLEYFHTLTWLYALFPITWVLSAIFNGIALIFIYPKETKKLDLVSAC